MRGLQKPAKPLCPACESAVLDASSEEIALAPAVESRDCDHGGHNQLCIRFGHVLSKPLETTHFAYRWRRPSTYGYSFDTQVSCINLLVVEAGRSR